MGLLSEITEDIQDAFDTDLSDAVKSITASHYSRTESDFNPSDGSVTRSKSDFSIRGVLINPEEKEENVQGSLPDKAEFLVLQAELDIAGTIEIGDTLLIESVIYTIYGIKQDPIKATKTFMIKGGS